LRAESASPDSFKYDPFGRRVYKSSSSVTSIYAYVGDNLVEETNPSGMVVARYAQGLNIDEPLAMLRSSTTSYFQADGLGSITSLSNSSGSIANTYTYDFFGELTNSTGSLVNAYDGDNLVEETNSAGSVVARYEQTQNIDEPLAMLRSSATSYFHADGLGSVTSLSNSAGSVANTYTYDSFGKLTASSGSLLNPFQYTARESDSETGLYYYITAPDTTTQLRADSSQRTHCGLVVE